MRSRSPWAVRLVRAKHLVFALFVSVPAAAIGGEVVLRLSRPPEYRRPTTEADATLWKNLVHARSEIVGLDYEMKAGVRREVDGLLVETNSFGMRDDEPLRERGAGDVRIVAVGDSLTFGMKVTSSEAWPNALESRLNALAPSDDRPDGRHFEVLNMGVSGYSAHDDALVVRNKALPLAPDLVVIGYYLNDPETEPVQQLHQHFRTARSWEHSALLRLLAYRKRLWDQDRLGGGDIFRYLHRSPAQWSSVLAAFDDIAAATSAHRTPVLLVVLPTLRGYERWQDYPYADLHRQIMETARAAGFEALDVLPTWRASGRAPADLSVDGEHPNRLGHALIADAVLAELASKPWLLEAGRSADATATRSTPPAR